MAEYAGKQFVGIDLHRRRSVIVRMTDAGEVLETTRIVNDAEALAAVVARAGESAEVVLEATYGWYWAADVIAAQGAHTHLAHPLGVKAFENRRVKKNVRDAADLADLLRMNRLPEAWIAPPATRELRELVRHRAKLVAVRSHCKAEVHAVLAKCGVQVSMSDLFGVEGTALLDRLDLPGPYAARIASLRRLMDLVEFEVEVFAKLARRRLVADPGYIAVQAIPGIGAVLGAVFVAEIGDINRFDRPEQLTCWAGLTPKHHESDTHVHRGRITKQGSRLVRWARSNRCRCCPRPARSGRSGTGSPPAGAATSASWPRLVARSSTSSTPCVTITSAPCCAAASTPNKCSNSPPARKPLPADHATAALAYRVRELVTPKRPRRSFPVDESLQRAPQQQGGPSLGM